MMVQIIMDLIDYQDVIHEGNALRYSFARSVDRIVEHVSTP